MKLIEEFIKNAKEKQVNMTDKEKRIIVKDDYNAIADIYNNSYGDISDYQPYIDEFISKLAGNKVLDVGCGDGQIVNYISEKGFDVIGVDFSEKLLEIARKNYPKLNFVNTDICEYKTNEKFDGIISKDALFHIPNKNLIEVLLKFKQILKANGKLCIIMDIPKEDGEQIFVEELGERYKIYYNYMKPEKVKKLLLKTGFKIDDMKILQENDNASSYASGLMVFVCKI